MSRVALLDWIETAPQAEDGTRFWRPDVPAGIGAWSAFDLRGLGHSGAIVYAKDQIGAFPGKAGRLDIGERLGEGMAAGRANQVGNRLGRSIAAGTTPAELIADIAGSRLATREVEPGKLRRRLRLLDQTYDFTPIVRGGATDDFNRADGGLGANWVTVQSALAISGNKVVVGANPSSMHYTGTFADDQYSQAACTCSVSGFYMVSAIVRASPANGAEFYFCRLCGTCGDAALGKRVAFSQSEFASGGSLGTSVPTTRTLRLEIAGSALEAFVGGSSVVTSTDTDLASGNPGIHIATANTTDASIDNFDGGDLSTPITQSLSGGITPTGALTRAATLYPIIVSSADTAATAGPVTVNMPASIVAGNVLLALISTDAGVTATPGGGQGWTSITDTAQSTNVRLVILAKIAAGSDALTLTLGTSQDCAVHVMQIGRHGVTSVSTDIAKGTAVAQGTANTAPDPPSVTPAAAVPNLIIACNASDDDDNTTPYAPTNYTAQAQVESAQSTSSCMIQVAVRRLATGAAENPGTFTLAAAEEWVAQTLCIPPAPSGTTFTQSPTGSIASAGALVRQPGKRATGASTPAGALLRSAAKLLAGSSTPTGIVWRSTSKTHAGTVGSTGALLVLRLLTRAYSGTIGSAGSLLRSTGKATAGTLTPAAVVRRVDDKRTAGTITPTGFLAKLSPRAVAGTIAPGGVLWRATGKVHAGTITSAGALARARTMTRSFAGTLAPAGLLVRLAAKRATGTLAPAGSAPRTLGKAVAGTIGSGSTQVRSIAKRATATLLPGGALAKFSPRSFAGTIASGSTLSALRVLLRSMAGSIGSSAILRRTPVKAVGGTLAPAAAIRRDTAKRATGTVAPTSTLSALRLFARALAGTIASTGSVARSSLLSRSLDGTVSPLGTLTREARRTLSSSISSVGGLVRRPGKGLGATITPTGTAARYTARFLAGTIASTGTLSKLLARTLGGVIGTSSSLARSTPGPVAVVWAIVRTAIVDRTTASMVDTTSAGVEDRTSAGIRRRVTVAGPISPGSP